jgi:hypothetical protein
VDLVYGELQDEELQDDERVVLGEDAVLGVVEKDHTHHYFLSMV